MEWIVTDDIRRETWRRLFEFANADIAVEAISTRHGVPKNNSELQNYKKQARQIRVCILQAKEYFDAAEGSSLFTSPDHAYYGVISLASMMMLLLGDGSSSLDVLRRDKKNNNHGLGFSTGCDAMRASRGVTLLEETRVEILQHGNFSNWYKTLPLREFLHAVFVTNKDGFSTRSLRLVGHNEIPKFNTLVGKKYSICELLKYLPDLSADLYRAGIDVARTKVTHRVEENVPGKTLTFVWYLHGTYSVAYRDSVLEGFEVESGLVNSVLSNLDDISGGGTVRISWDLGATNARIRWPNPRDTMSHDTFYYADKVETPEFADLYLVAFQLSMIARYFPDLWISCIESQCKAAKLIESVVEVIKRKMPMLALNTITPGGGNNFDSY